AHTFQETFRALDRAKARLNPVERLIFSLMLANTNVERNEKGAAVPDRRTTLEISTTQENSGSRNGRPRRQTYFFFGAAFLTAGRGAASNSSPVIFDFSVSKVSMKGSFVKAEGTPSNSITVPVFGLPAIGSSSLSVISCTAGFSIPTTSSLERTGGLAAIRVPFSLGTAAFFRLDSKYCSPLGAASSFLMPIHMASCGLL